MTNAASGGAKLNEDPSLENQRVLERRLSATPHTGPERRRAASPLHFRRIEFKYIVPERFIEEFLDRISPFTDPDPFLKEAGRSWYPVTSMYFDSFDLQSLFAKEAGYLSRRRIRLRTYDGDFSGDGTAFLEIKRRHDFLISKDRLPLSIGEADDHVSSREFLRSLLRLVRDGPQELVEEAKTVDAWFNLQPTALVSYDRTAFVGKEDRNLRLSIDRHLKGVWKPWKLRGPMPYRHCGVDPIIPRLLAYGAHQDRAPNPLRASAYNVIEFKFSHAIPGWLHRIVIDMQLSRSAYSKYGSVVRELRPNLFESMED